MTHLGRDRLFGTPISLAPALRPEREAEIDPTLAELFRAFDERCDALRRAAHVAERRGAPPCGARADAAPRHDCRVGNGAELTTLRCDNLMMLALRGFERPCAWSEAEYGRR